MPAMAAQTPEKTGKSDGPGEIAWMACLVMLLRSKASVYKPRASL
jgi:hypothetical protein